MKKLQKRNLFFALLFAGLVLYLLGDLKSIQPDTRAFSNSLTELILLHIFLFSTLTFSLYQIFVILSKRDPRKDLVLIISGFISCVLIYFTINPPFIDTSRIVVSAPYRYIGDFLRDQHGINWYFMDWGGWVITVILYFFPVYTLVVYHLIQQVRKRF